VAKLYEPLYEFLNKPQAVVVDLEKMTKQTWHESEDTPRVPKDPKTSSLKLPISERLWSIGGCSTTKQADIMSSLQARRKSFWQQESRPSPYQRQQANLN